MKRQPGVIILGCTHGGLAAVRSFGKRNIRRMVLTYNEDEFGLASRYVDNWQLCPHPRDEEAFINHLLGYADEWGGSLILETNDYFLQALSRNKDRLSEHFHLASPKWEHAQTFLEKDQAYRLADEIGVPHPKIKEPQTMAELEEAIDSLNFPVMIKPINSHEFVPIFGTKLFIIDSPSELRDKFQQTLDANQPIVISEIIPGSDYKTLERVHMYVNSQGDVAVAFCNLKLRQTPPMYGVMRVGRSTAPNAEVLELATKLLQAIDYRGFASVEFKRDHRDNLLKLMEVNIRMPRSLPLPIASGVDFPYLIYRDLVHDDQIIIKEYNPETYLIEITADLADFIRYDKNRNLRQFVQPYLARHKTFSYLDFSDPMPFLNQTFGRSTRFILKKLGLRRK